MPGIIREHQHVVTDPTVTTIPLSETEGEISAHEAAADPHPGYTTAAELAIGLGTKENSQTAASQAEAEAGSETAVRKWSPLRIAQAIASLATGGGWPLTDDVDADGHTIQNLADPVDDGDAVPKSYAETKIPAADAAPTLDTTTYVNPETDEPMPTLVLPSDQAMAVAVAVEGDAFPRWLWWASAEEGLYLGDGTFDPYSGNAALFYKDHDGDKILGAYRLTTLGANRVDEVPMLSQLSPYMGIVAGPLSTQQFVSGGGAQVGGSSADVETHTPVTLTDADGTCKVELSPDQVTYSELATIAPGVDGAVVDVSVRVPATWSLRLTVVNATLGITTWY